MMIGLEGHSECCMAMSMCNAATWNCSKVRLWSSTNPFNSFKLVVHMAVVMPSVLVTMVSASSSTVLNVV